MADAASFARRLAGRDTSLWPDGNVATSRLGWLDVVGEMRAEAAAIADWAAAVNAEHPVVALFGMGGSSLAPEVLRTAAGCDSLIVLDSTHPRTVRRALDRVVDGAGLALIASKSGSTIEPNAMLAAFAARVPEPGRVAGITDPGTTLDATLTEEGARAVFRNRPDIGGRYSALSLFGLVPAALAGYDLTRLLAFDDTDLLAGVELGLNLAAEHAAGRDKVTVLTSPTVAAFGLWVEQLLAESTGKRGTGLIPVAGEGAYPSAPLAPADTYADDRTFVIVTVGGETVPGAGDLAAAGRPVIHQHLDDIHDLGELFFRWEVATAIAGAELGIDPFDEPDVAAAKAATKAMLESWPDSVSAAETPGAALEFVARALAPSDYVALLAYLPDDPAVDEALAQLQGALRDRHTTAVTRGFGPRYLHSTGQLHKGGPPSVIAVQLLSTPSEVHGADGDLPIPGEPFTFGRLIAAQALGDATTLRSRGRRVIRVELGPDPAGALRAMAGDARP